MRRLTARLRSRAILSFFALLTACSTGPLDRWRNDQATPQPLRHLAIFVVMQDAGLAQLIEEEIAARLPQAHAASAIAHKLEANDSSLRERMQQEGYDNALVVRLIQQDPFTPLPALRTQLRNGDNALLPYQRELWRYLPYAVSTRAGVSNRTDIHHLVETRLYRLPDGTLIASTLDESLQPGSPLHYINSALRLVQAEQTQAAP